MTRSEQAGPTPARGEGAFATHEPELVFQVLRAVAQAHATGRTDVIERFGLTSAQAARLASLSMQDLHELARDGAYFFRLKVRVKAIEEMLAHLQEEEQRELLENRLLHLGAPAEMMAALFGMLPAECARRRQALGIVATHGRPRAATEEEEERIWQAWQSTAGAPEAERYETVASRCGAPLTVIWALRRRWESEGVLSEAPAPRRGRPTGPRPRPGSGPAPVAAAPGPPPPARRLWQRLTRRPDTEGQQAVIRLLISLLLIGYTWAVADQDPRYLALPAPAQQLLYVIPPLGLLWPAVQIAWILRRPRLHPLRRGLGLVYDVAMLSAFLWWLGPYGGAIYVIYLWVVLGHGMRFGPRSLVAAATLALLGWSLILVVNDYWQAQRALAWGLLLGLVLIPAYAYLLLRQRLQAQREAHQVRVAATAAGSGVPAPGAGATGR